MSSGLTCSLFSLAIVRGPSVRDFFQLKVTYQLDDSGCLPLVFCTQISQLPWAEPVALREVRSPHSLPPFLAQSMGSCPGGGPGASWVICPCRYTMTKSSAVLFILIFSLIFKLEELVRPRLPQSLLHPQTLRLNGVSEQWLVNCM